MKRTAGFLVIILFSQLTPPAAAVSDKPIPAELNILLEGIERAGAKLKSFQAEMVFKQEQLLMDTVTIRNGRLYYQTDNKTVRARIHFSDFLQQDLEDPTAAKRVKFNEDYAFDGMWVRRRNERTKSRQWWEVSKKSHNKEAFRLGKGPFPLPFAIRRQDVLEHFEVNIIKSDPNDPKETIHLKLKPKKKSTYAEEYVRMDLWVSRKSDLPVQISYEKDDFEITTVTWSKPVIDKKIKDSVFSLPPVGAGWPEPEIHRLKESLDMKTGSNK